MPTAILIDDMPQAIEGLTKDLATFCPEVKIIGTAGGVVEGAKLLLKESPDILFLDIMMGDGTGFDLLEILPKTDFQLIFTTASDEFAIKAFRYAAVDYLLKPIDPEQLKMAVQKADSKLNHPPEQWNILKEVYQNPKLPNRIALHTLEKIHITNVSEIVRCESDSNCTWFYFENQPKLLVTKTLKQFEQTLQGQDFLRVHQSHLVNLNYVREFVKSEGGYLMMKNGDHIPVSVRKRQLVFDWLEG